MFKRQNFCHIASNNRNNVKVGVFVYRTSDDLATVTTSGYFNEKIIDINLHDLIIHEKIDQIDNTKVEKNVLCVIGKTLDNISTTVIKSKWQGDIEQEIADLQQYVDDTFVRKDGTSIMTGPLKFRAGSFEGAIAGGLGDGIAIYKMNPDGTINSEVASLTNTNGFVPGTTNTLNMGTSALKWKDAYIARVITAVLNNGGDIAIPNDTGTMALTKDIKDGTLTITQGGQTKGTFTANQDTNTTIDIDAVNTDLSNLSSVGKNISNWSTNVTNCPIEEAKDIKIELGTGTNANKIIVRAGSKTYVPNGAGTFTPLTLANDLVMNPIGSYTGDCMLFIRNNGSILDQCIMQNATSGTTAPSGEGWWWDTTNNLIKFYSGGSDSGARASVPIARIHRTSGNWDKIEFVFNGIGYMGGRYFALPGLKGLTPRGRNADGTLNNTVVTTDVVKTVDIPTSFTGVSVLAINQAGIYTIGPTSWEYNEALNFFMNPNGNGATSAHYEAAFATATNGAITTFNPKVAFRAVDYSDFERRISPLETADAQNVKLTGNQTIAGTKTFSAAAYGTASDAVNSILTTVNKTKAANGYVKLGNGLIIQWGYVAPEAASATGTVNFPVAFTTTNYTVCMRWAGTAATNGFLIETSSLTTTGFAYYHNAFNTGVNPNIEKRWVAIGY